MDERPEGEQLSELAKVVARSKRLAGELAALQERIEKLSALVKRDLKRKDIV